MKTIVITGATSGIGYALAKYFSKNNKVFAGYRNEEKVSMLEEMGAIPFYIDMTNSNSIKQAAAFIKSETSKIDTLINVAGCVVAGVTETINIDKLREQFEVNTFSHLDFTQNLLERLDGGKIINISSVASFGIFPFIAPYCASKRALDILFNALMVETKHNIKVVSIKPGVIATPLWEKSIKNNKDSITNCEGYQNEMFFMVKNARKNQTNGLDVSKVVKLISKVDKMKNPKPSYTIGIDSKMAEILSHLPLSWINKLVKLGLKIRCS